MHPTGLTNSPARNDSDRAVGICGRNLITEVFRPASQTFLPGSDMLSIHHKIFYAIAVSPSGAILVAGRSLRLEVFINTPPPKGIPRIVEELGL